jgi:hypothetical protein
VLTKRAVVLSILSGGTGVSILLIYAGWPPTYPPKLQMIAAQMTFFGAASAAIGAARTPGRWSERITTEGIRSRIFPSWVWPMFFVLLAVANYLVALAVLLGSLPFARRSNSN